MRWLVKFVAHPNRRAKRPRKNLCQACYSTIPDSWSMCAECAEEYSFGDDHDYGFGDEKSEYEQMERECLPCDMGEHDNCYMGDECHCCCCVTNGEITCGNDASW